MFKKTKQVNGALRYTRGDCNIYSKSEEKKKELNE